MDDVSPFVPMWVRVDSITRVGLPPVVAIAHVATAMGELAVAQSFQLIHGNVAGYRRYVEVGGCVRFTSYGEAFIRVDLRRGMSDPPWCKVTRAQAGGGRNNLLGPAAVRRAHRWDLDLDCGHAAERPLRFRRGTADLLPAPKRVRCAECFTMYRAA